MLYCVFSSPIRSYLQVFLSLCKVNREFSKVCLQIIFVCGSETGSLAWGRKIHVGKCLFQSRTGLLILFLSAATFVWGIPENKYELWGYIKSNKSVRKTPASRSMNLELCKFPRVHLTRFRLVQRQSATVTAHTCALSWHSPFKVKKY